MSNIFRATVLYPRTDGTSFDITYYKKTHVELVRRELEPYYGVLTLEWDEMIGSRGGSTPQLSMARLMSLLVANKSPRVF